MNSRRRGAALRELAAIFLLGFFLAVAAVPHRHLNGLDDLLSGDRSDSGTLIEALVAATGASGQEFHPYRTIADEPCLACFHNDFLASVAPFLGLEPALVLLFPVTEFAARTPPEPKRPPPGSRSPPSH